MQLKLQRSQRTTGVMSKTVMFCIDARVSLTAEEQANIQKYKLGSQVIYSSEAAKRHQAKFEAHQKVGEIAHSYGHIAKGLMHAIANRMSLNITVDSLQRGQHIECKDLDEVMDAEEALMDACTSLKNYLATAVTFDGREAVIDFSQDESRPV